MSAETDETEAVQPPPADVEDGPRLTWPQRVARGVLVAAFCAVAMLGGILGLRSRERNDEFVQHQLPPVVVSKADVEQAVADSLPPTRSIDCSPSPRGGATRSPWTCTAGGERFTVRVDGTGAYSAKGRNGFRGCCLPVPVAR